MDKKVMRSIQWKRHKGKRQEPQQEREEVMKSSCDAHLIGDYESWIHYSRTSLRGKEENRYMKSVEERRDRAI
jgi:hypothetical protein